MTVPATSTIEYRKTVLDNGLRLLVAPMPHTRSVAVNVFVGAGSRYEAPAEAGVSHFLEHLAFKGTERRPTPRELSEAIEGVGGSMNAGTDRESTTYWSRVGRDHFTIAMDILGDILLHSRLDPQDVEKERLVIQEELRMANDGPDERSSLLLDELLWPDQPLGRDVGGTYDSVQRLSRSTILDYYAQEYGPSNAIVVVAGSVSYEQVLAECERLFAGWPPANPRAMTPYEAKLPSSSLKIEYRKTEQAHIAVGLAGIPINHPNRHALGLLSTILGNGMASRLFLNLREEKGLVYDVHSSVSHLRDCGAVVVYAGADPKRAKDAVQAIVSELNRATKDLTQEELSRARELSKGRLFLGMEDTRSVAWWLGSQEMFLDRIYSVDEVAQQLDALTLDDLMRAGEELFQPEHYRATIVGPFRSKAPFRRILEDGA